MSEHSEVTGVREAPVEQETLNHMENLVGYILLIGVLLSVGLIIAGTLWNWAITQSLTTEYSISGENFFAFLTSSLRQLLAGAIEPRLLISLGMITLMLTPFLRVAASMVYFAFVNKNVKYSLITLFVFAVLTYSLFLR